MQFFNYWYCLGIQANVTVEDSQIGNDFVAELVSSHPFTLPSTDLARLLVIRTAKIKKKNDRLFEQMGLSNVTETTTPSKKIFLSKQNKILKRTVDSEGNIFRFDHIFLLAFFSLLIYTESWKYLLWENSHFWVVVWKCHLDTKENYTKIE